MHFTLLGSTELSGEAWWSTDENELRSPALHEEEAGRSRLCSWIWFNMSSPHNNSSRHGKKLASDISCLADMYYSLLLEKCKQLSYEFAEKIT